MGIIRSNAGRSVMFIDADKQLSLSNILEIRNKDSKLKKINLVQKTGDDIINTINDFVDKYDDIIIDTGGADSLELRHCLLCCDVFVTPVRASQLDVATLRKVDQLVYASKSLRAGNNFSPLKKVLLVANCISTNPMITEYDELIKIAPEFQHLPFFNSPIRDRIAFRKAASHGKSVLELEIQDNKANDEILNLYKEIFND
jgi:chromosome partitioning protein